MANRHPGLGQPQTEHHDREGRVIIHNHIDIAPFVTLMQHLETLLITRMDRFETILQEVKTKMAGLEGQLGDLSNKFDSVTTAFGTSIQAAIDRLAAEIAKQGGITPAAQLILDHLSADAEGLVALNGTLLNAFVQQPPIPIPPEPAPLPPVEPLPPEVLTARRKR
jgi:hypothetical protein